MEYKKKVLWLIAWASALRLLFAIWTELGPDEVYYWTFARTLQWNYFDHPPVVAWLIRLTTGNLLFHSELAVRIGAVFCSGFCTWLIFKLGSLVYSERAGWFAALLFTSSLYCSIAAGVFILPDSPQLIFWFLGIILLIKISRITDEIKKADLLWCAFGLVTGLCIMCKMHGVFLWFGVLLYLLFIDGKWLKYKGLYLAACITLIIISPIIIWNVQHNFITFSYHSSRIVPNSSGFDPTLFFKALLQQVTGSNPFNFFLICSAAWLALKEKLPLATKEFKILIFLAAPLILTVLIISIFRETLSHWSGPAYSCLLILPAVSLASTERNKTRYFPNVIIWALSYIVFIATFQALITNYFPGPLSQEKQGQKTGAKDVTLDMYGWREISTKFDSLYKGEVKQKIMPINARIIVTNWATAASIEFYVTYFTKQEVYGIGEISDLHQYYITNQSKIPLKPGEDAYYIVPTDAFYYRTSNQVFDSFKDHEIAMVIPQYRSGLVCRFITIYRMLNYKKSNR